MKRGITSSGMSYIGRSTPIRPPTGKPPLSNPVTFQ